MKVVINREHGGFGLSDEAFERYLIEKQINYKKVQSKHSNDYYFYQESDNSQGDDADMLWDGDIARNDPILVKIVEEMEESANGLYSSLKIVEIPDDVEWEVQEYDGLEWIAEKHRTWS